MIVCNRCDCEIKHGDEYKVACDKVWCIECAENTEQFDGSFGMTYVMDKGERSWDYNGA